MLWNQPTIIKSEQKEDTSPYPMQYPGGSFLSNRTSLNKSNNVFGANSPQPSSNNMWNMNQSSTEGNTSINASPATLEKENLQTTEPLFHSVFGQQYLNDLDTSIATPEEETKHCSHKSEINSNDVAQTNEDIMAAFMAENSMQTPHRASGGNNIRRQHLEIKSKPCERKKEKTMKPFVQQENMFIKQENIFEEKPINLEFNNYPTMQNTDVNPLNYLQIKQDANINVNPFLNVPNLLQIKQEIGINEEQNKIPMRYPEPVARKNVETCEKKNTDANINFNPSLPIPTFL